MKLIQLSVLSAIVILSSCNYAEEQRQAYEASIKKEKNIKKNYDKNGRLLSIAEFSNGKKNGITKNYYPDGSIGSELIYVNDVRHGKAVWYYRNGQPYRESYFKNDRIHGKRTYYYLNGALMAETFYNEGKLLEGTKEYTTSGKEIELPTIQFRLEDQLSKSDKVYLYMNLSNDAKEVEYYFLQPVKGRTELAEVAIKSDNGFGKIEFHLPKGKSKEIDITYYAKSKTNLGHPFIIKKTYHLSIEN